MTQPRKKKKLKQVVYELCERYAKESENGVFEFQIDPHAKKLKVRRTYLCTVLQVLVNEGKIFRKKRGGLRKGPTLWGLGSGEITADDLFDHENDPALKGRVDLAD